MTWTSLKNLTLFVATLLLSPPISAKEMPAECAGQAAALGANYDKLIASMEEATQSVFQQMPADFRAQFKNMELRTCRTNALKSMNEAEFEKLQKKYAESLSQVSLPGWNVSFEHSIDLNLTEEQVAEQDRIIAENEAAGRLSYHGLEGSTNRLTIVLSRDIDNDGDHLSMTRILDVCTPERYSVHVKSENMKLNKRLNETVYLGSREDTLLLLPSVCDPREEETEFRDSVGEFGAEIEDINYVSGLLKLPGGVKASTDSGTGSSDARFVIKLK